MEHGAAALDAAVMATSRDVIVDHENRADGNAAFREAGPGFGDGCSKKGVP